MSLHVESAQLPASTGDDRLVVTDDAVIVLDGATAHDPAMPTAGRYVDCLAAELARSIGEPIPLTEVLAQSIRRTVAELEIRPGPAPSSTVAVVRVEPDAVDAMVLGDSSVIVGRRDGTVAVHTDDRLSRLRLPEAERYRCALAEGQGYDERHRATLRQLQAAERKQRNRPGGYWIAEAEPAAAEYALSVRYPADDVSWVIAATDGVVDLVPVIGVSWPEVASMSTHDLGELLARIHRWEAETDPNGQTFPRAKRHDDKTVAVLHPFAA